MMNLKPIYQLYIVAGIAFALALVKYLFLNFSVSIKFFIVEALSYLAFLGLVYFCDIIIRNWKNEQNQRKLDKENLSKEFMQEIERLNTKIKTLSVEKKQGDIVSDEVDMIAETISGSIANESDIEVIGKKLLEGLARYYEICIGLSYFLNESSGKYIVKSVYGISNKELIVPFDQKDGLHGHTVNTKAVMKVSELDEEYFNIESYSGGSKPTYLYILPLVKDEKTLGLLELATFKAIGIENHWDKLNSIIAESLVINV